MGRMKDLLIEREESARLAHAETLDASYDEWLSGMKSMEDERYARTPVCLPVEGRMERLRQQMDAAASETARQREEREKRDVLGWPEQPSIRPAAVEAS